MVWIESNLYVFLPCPYLLVWKYTIGYRRIQHHSILHRVRLSLVISNSSLMSLTVGGNTAGMFM